MIWLGDATLGRGMTVCKISLQCYALFGQSSVVESKNAMSGASANKHLRIQFQWYGHIAPTIVLPFFCTHFTPWPPLCADQGL
ncbi:MAG: hypothetical protein R6V27_09655, partial [Balneolaceae bacterium]